MCKESVIVWPLKKLHSDHFVKLTLKKNEGFEKAINNLLETKLADYMRKYKAFSTGDWSSVFLDFLKPVLDEHQHLWEFLNSFLARQPQRIQNYGDLNWDQGCMVSPPSMTIIRRQSCHFELRISQTSIFLDSLKAVLDKHWYLQEHKNSILVRQPLKHTKLLVLKLRPGLLGVSSISDHN